MTPLPFGTFMKIDPIWRSHPYLIEATTNQPTNIDDDDDTWLTILTMLKMRRWRKKMQSFANWSIFNFAKKFNMHKRSGQFSWKNAFLLEAASKRWHLNCKRLQDDLHEIWNDATSQLWSCTGGDLLWSTLRASLLFAAAVTRTVRWSSRKAKGVDNRTSGSRPYQQLPGPEVDRHPSSWHCLEINIM